MAEMPLLSSHHCRDVSSNQLKHSWHFGYAYRKRILPPYKFSTFTLCLILLIFGYCTSATTDPSGQNWFASGGIDSEDIDAMPLTVNSRRAVAHKVSRFLLLWTIGVTNTTSLLVPPSTNPEPVSIANNGYGEMSQASRPASASFSPTSSALHLHGGDYGTPTDLSRTAAMMANAPGSSVESTTTTRRLTKSSKGRPRRISTKLLSASSAVSNTSIRRQHLPGKASSSSLRSNVYGHLDTTVMSDSTSSICRSAAAAASAVTRIGRHGSSNIAANEVEVPLTVTAVVGGEASYLYTDQREQLPPLSRAIQGMTNWIQSPSLNVARGLVVFASAIYGTNFALIKVLDNEMPSSISAVLRFSLAAAVVAGVVLSSEIRQDQKQRTLVDKELALNPEIDSAISYKRDVQQLEEERWSALRSGAEIGLFYCVGYIFQAEALSTIEAGKSAFFNGLAVVIVPLLDAAFRGRGLTPQVTLSVVLACAGVALMNLDPSAVMGDGGGAGSSLLTFSTGDVLALSQTLFFGVGYWRLEELSQRHKTQASRLTVGQLGAVAVGAILYALFRGGGGDVLTSDTIVRNWPLMMDQWATWLSNPVVLSAIVWTGLMSTAFALYLETVALKVISATELTLIMTSVSLFGAAFAWVTLGEVLSSVGMMGGALILGGCVLGSLPSPEPTESTHTKASSVDGSSPGLTDAASVGYNEAPIEDGNQASAVTP